MQMIKNVISKARQTITTSLFFTALLSLIINPLFAGNNGFRSFDRVFGNATLVGIDANARISHFTLFYLLFIPICLAVSMLICYWFTRSTEGENLKCKDSIKADRIEAFEFLNSISICALTLSVVFILNKYNSVGADNYLRNYAVQISLVIVFATLIYIKRPFMSFGLFRQSLLMSFGVTLFVNFIVQSNTADGENATLRFGVIFVLTTAACLFILQKISNIDIARLKLSFVPLSYGMLFSGLALEFCNILNQHDVFITRRLIAAKLVYGLLLGISILLYIFSKKKWLSKLRSFTHWETISIIGLLVSLYYFTVIPPLAISAGTELFEQANHGMLANDFLAWGKIPIVNSFDGHMLMSSLGMVLYGLLNGDVLGASYFCYTFVWTLPYVVCLYLVYKNVFGKDFALFFMLIAPSVSTLGVRLGVISVIALLYTARKRTFVAYLLLLFSVVVSFLYEAPTGISYGGSALLITITLLVVQVIEERKFTSEVRAFAKAFGVFVGVMAVLWCGLCLIQSVDPIKRALEFIGIAQSTNNWTRASIGDPKTVTFSLMYSVLPLIAVCCLIMLIVKYKNTPANLASAAFLSAYILNWTRALGRHSMEELQLDIIMWTAILGIALFAAAVLPKWKKVAFLITGVLVATSVFNINALYSSTSVANNAILNSNNSGIYYDGTTDTKTIRVNLSAPLEQWKNVIGMINSVIPEGETYVDLSSQTMLYALSGREKPVYVNQSPLHLSGEYSQLRFIEEVEAFKGTCDFALLYDGGFSSGYSGGLDGVAQVYRYYYVYEWLYENFRPLCKSSDNFILWVRKDRYDEFSISEEQREVFASIPLNTANERLYGATAVSVSPLIIQCFAEDPQIYLPLTTQINVAPVGRICYEIEVTYKSSASGTAQIFYDYTGLNETDSTKNELAVTSDDFITTAFSIPLRNDTTILNAIRLDPPSGSEFELKSVNIIAVKSNGLANKVYFWQPIVHADLTDNSWTNGFLNKNTNQVLFDATIAGDLAKAKVIYTATESANVIAVNADSKWISLILDKDASIVESGIIGAEIYATPATPIDYNYLGTTHTVDLGQIPYVWGQYDNKKASENTLVKEFSFGSGEVTDDVQQAAKYALITIDAPAEGNAILAFQNTAGENISVFNFSLLEGQNRYIIRVSTDWWWNSGNIVSYGIEVDIGAQLKSVKFLVGE